MLSDLAVFYLFLGGTGAGVIALCAVVDILWIRQPFGVGVTQGPSFHPVVRVVEYAMLIGLIMLAAGIVALLADLGRIDRALSLFLNPSFTWLTVGSYALIVTVLLAAFLTAVRFLSLPYATRTVVAWAERIVVVAAMVVMLYTGFLLQSLGVVAFWDTLFIPVLFFLSSLSCGVAVLLVVDYFIDEGALTASLRKCLMGMDLAVIVVEVVCVVAFVFVMSDREHPGVQTSLDILLHSELAWVWWFGFCGCGLALPLVGEGAVLLLRRPSRLLMLVVAVAVLVGGCALRFAIVEAGAHREPVLEMTVESAEESSSVKLAQPHEARFIEFVYND